MNSSLCNLCVPCVSVAIFPNHYLSLKGENLISALNDLGMDADEFKEAVGGSCGY